MNRKFEKNTIKNKEKIFIINFIDVNYDILFI